MAHDDKTSALVELVNERLDEACAAHDARMAWRCLLDLGFLYTSRDFAVLTQHRRRHRCERS
jgi:hypothetical protein